MPRKKSTKKMYIVKSVGRNYTYGAFPYTDEGKADAEKFVKRMSKERKEELVIKSQ